MKAESTRELEALRIENERLRAALERILSSIVGHKIHWPKGKKSEETCISSNAIENAETVLCNVTGGGLKCDTQNS